ncbi:hypothetical protein [Nibrella viscosa]
MIFSLIELISQLVRAFQPVIESNQSIYEPLSRVGPGAAGVCDRRVAANGLTPVLIDQPFAPYRFGRTDQDDTTGLV